MPKAARNQDPKARVLEDGALMLFGVVGSDFFGFTAAEVVEDLHRIDNPDPLRVLINSPGGDVAEGLAIYHELATYEGKIEVEVVGVAASMASVIAMAGDTVKVAERAHMMIHDPWNVAVGNAEEMRRAAELLDRFGTTLAEIYARRTGKSEDEIKELMSKNNGEGVWFDAAAAVDFGLADEVMPDESDDDVERALAKMDLSRLALVPAALAKRARLARARFPHGDTDHDGKVPSGAAEGGRDRRNEMPDKKETTGKAPDAPKGDEKSWDELVKEHGATPQPDKPTAADQRSQAAAEQARAAERKRWADLKAIAEPYPDEMLPTDLVDKHIALDTSAEEFREIVLKILAAWTRQNGPNVNARVTVAEQDKFIQGATDWLIIRSGNRALVEQAQDKLGEAKRKLDAGEFRGMTLLELGRESLSRSGTRTNGLSKMELASVALGLKGPRAANYQTPSDFPILLENVLNKMLQAAYTITPDTWRSFTRSGTVNDFRDNPRLRLGTLGRLDDLLPSGEFQHKNFPDAEKESIRAATVGNIVGISRQAIVNDDVDGFSRIITMLGRAAQLSIESEVYDVVGANSGLGPTMRDGNPLFDASHGNIATPAATPTVDALDAARVLMAQQQDPEGNELLDLRPAVWVGPIGLGGEVRVTVAAEFDFAAETSGDSGQFRKPNKVRDFVSTIVDTARLTGTRWYLFADPAVTPTLEVVFLDGQESPVLETQEGFDFDGIRWRVRHDFGVDATDFRPAVTNAGA